MRFTRGDVRDHIVSSKIDHGPPWWRGKATQQQRSPKINFREIFRVVRFSTFATISAQNGHTPSLSRSPPGYKVLGSRRRWAVPTGHNETALFHHGSRWRSGLLAARHVSATRSQDSANRSSNAGPR